MFFFAHTYTFTTVKEILLYDSIFSYTSQVFVTALEEAKDQEISVRVNCDGGEPECGWGMIAKFSEHVGKKKVKVDGKAYSMAAFFLCYADDAECLDVTEFLIHRAAYSPWFEKDPNYFTDSLRANLERINKSLRAAFEAKVDVAKFEALKGVKVKDVFSMDSRIDVFLSAAEAKKIGLVSKVTKITPEKRAEIDSYAQKIAARYTVKTVQADNEDTEIEKENSNQNPTTMTLEEIKDKHPGLYAQILAIGVKDGAAAEKERIEALLVYNEIAPKEVAAAIESGAKVTGKMMAEMSLLASRPKSLEQQEKEAKEKGETTTTEEGKEKTEKEAAKADFMKDVNKNLGKK